MKKMMSVEGLTVKVAVCKFWNFDEKVPKAGGFITSTGSRGLKLNICVATGDEEPALYPFTVMVQAAAADMTPLKVFASQP